jgi:hypothetical protein
MPAIQSARLKIHSAELAQQASDPDEFCRAFYEFLDLYADRTYRPGLFGTPPPLIHSIRVAQAVMRAVLQELIPFAVSERDPALELTDALWAEPCLEFRLLAAYLIGQISPESPDLILNRILAWVEPNTEERLIDVLIVSGLERVREERPEIYIQQVEIWLRSKKNFEQMSGLKAISPLLTGTEFEDFPLIFRLLAPLIRSSPTSLRPEILAVIETLATRTPQETAYFLENLVKAEGENSIVPWYVRHSLVYFPNDLQIYLRKALRAKRELG